ncbi:flagellar protein FlgN [Alkalihalophilus marmarensis]|uniref:FlgN protein n=1 Tax=Alkalihalophilus marmarensis DSM 21297 TaxID=1188261 RepID=U6SJT1_9BACI|nr:flagellar protein FlgN [Alkalihalophilus marmarensis]ERN51974.1 hypothetical protein A33I_17940 [Alkalihalophilus marmarensis DSM 21297]
MSAQLVIQALAELLKLHQELNKKALQKPGAIKANDMNALSQVVREETKLIRAVQAADAKRARAAGELMRHKGEGREDATVQTLLTYTEGEDRLMIERLQQALLKEVSRLSEQNEQNKELIEESLRFVNLSLDLMVPQSEDVHYQHPTDKQEQTELYSRSAFDSKA